MKFIPTNKQAFNLLNNLNACLFVSVIVLDQTHIESYDTFDSWEIL